MAGRLLSLLLTAAAVVSAQVPDVKDLVMRFDAAQAKVNTLQAPFSLTIRRALLRTPTMTKGTMYLQGSEFVHFGFAPPEDLVLHLTPKALISYSPLAGAGEMLKIGLIRNADRRFLGLGHRLNDLSDYFKIEAKEGKEVPGSWELTLTPRSLGMRKRFQSLRLWIDRDSCLPRQVQWVERSGDSWLLELGALTLNKDLPTSVTGFKVPAGVPLRSEFSFFATRKK